jgi:hypothetical protein
MSEENIRGGFRGAGLVLFDAERVISCLDLHIQTPIPSNSRPGSSQTWISKTPNSPIEASSQSTLIEKRISQLQNSSPTHIISAVDQFAKGSLSIMYKMALMQSEIRDLRAANEALSKRRRANKTRLREGGTPSIHGICRTSLILFSR